MKDTLCKVLYALPDGVVEARRRSVVKPLVAAICGIVILAINYFAVEDSAGALSMMLLVSGLVLAVYGVVAVVLRLVGSERVPYDVAAKRYMSYRERFYDRELLPALLRAVEDGDNAAIDAMPTSNISAVTLAEYRTSANGMVAYVVCEYVGFESKPIIEPRVIRR